MPRIVRGHRLCDVRPQPAGAYQTAQRFQSGPVLDFAEPPVDFPGQHYAFLVSDGTFDGRLLTAATAALSTVANPAQATSGTESSAAGWSIRRASVA